MRAVNRLAVFQRSRPADEFLLVNERRQANLCRLRPDDDALAVITMARRQGGFDDGDNVAEITIKRAAQIDAGFGHLVGLGFDRHRLRNHQATGRRRLWVVIVGPDH